MTGSLSRIPLAVPNIGRAEEEAVLAAIRSGWVSSVGPEVTRFEAAVAAVSGAEAATAVASGTAAIMVALRALGIGPGDTVLVPTYTFIASANAVHASGARPVFVDISPETWAIDPAQAEAAAARLAREEGRPPRAILVVYPLGNPVDLAPYRALTAEHGTVVMVDAAAAIGATWEGAGVGPLADATTFSFNGNKTITTGAGGAIVGTADVVARARHLATTARTGADYDHDVPAYNERMSNLEAALGLAQLARLDELLAAKARIAAAVRSLAAELGCGTVPRDARAERCDWMPALVLNEEPIRLVLSRLREAGIETRLFWKPMHLQTAYRDATRYGPFDVADDLWERVLVLPCSTSLGAEDLARVTAEVRRTILDIRAGRLS